MKRNSRIIFKHSFGQFIEDNVEPPETGMQHVLIGSGRARGQQTSITFEPQFNKDVFEWRKRSLNGAVGEACPCSRSVPENVTEELLEIGQRNQAQALDQIVEEVAAMRRAMSEQTEAALRRMFESSPPFTLAVLNAAAQELGEIRAAEIRNRMVEFYQSRYNNREHAERFSRVVIQSLPCLHADGTTSNVWSPAQAFAMLGGYRPDRHGPCMVGVDLS